MPDDATISRTTPTAARRAGGARAADHPLGAASGARGGAVRAGRRVAASLIAFAAALAVACGDAPRAVPAPERVATVTVTPGTLTLGVGTRTRLAAVARDAAGRPLAGRSVDWTSDAVAVAAVDAAGEVVAVGEGSARIVATSEGRSGTATVTVQRPSPAPVARVALSDEALDLEAGASRALVATPLDADGGPLAGRAVTWASSDAAVAAVDADGVVTGRSAGIAVVSATSEGRRAAATVTVRRPPAVARVTVTAPPHPLEPGDAAPLVAALADSAGNVVVGRAVAWTTGDAAVAVVDAKGVVTARTPGRTTITATSEGARGSAVVAIDPPPGADLLYQRSVPDTNEIHVAPLGTPGAAPVRVNAGSVSRRPTASPDGRRIAFAVSMTTPIGEVVEDLFAVDRNGMHMRRLTGAPGVDDAPAWSPVPGADLIAYVHRDPATGREDVWVMRADGSGARSLTADLPVDLVRADPSWSPDGAWIAFAQSRGTAGPGRGSLWVMRADGSAKRQLTSHPGDGFDLRPSWSPDGTRIAFARGGIAIVTVATGEVTPLALDGRATAPAWSPDGRHVAYMWQPSAPGAGTWEIRTVRPDGTDVRRRVVDPGRYASAASPAWIARGPVP